MLKGEEYESTTSTNTALKTTVDDKVDNIDDKNDTSETDVAVTNGDRASYGMISRDSESYVSLSVKRTGSLSMTWPSNGSHSIDPTILKWDLGSPGTSFIPIIIYSNVLN